MPPEESDLRRRACALTDTLAPVSRQYLSAAAHEGTTRPLAKQLSAPAPGAVSGPGRRGATGHQEWHARSSGKSIVSR